MVDDKKKVKLCMLCGKPSESSICETCSIKVQGELLEHKHEVEKKGKPDSGRA
jgi:recombinational DNA repair protein RecR